MTKPILWAMHIISGAYLLILPWCFGVTLALGWVISSMCLGAILFLMGSLELITATLFGFFRE